MRASPPVFGVIGWKNSGKTLLVARLVAEFTARGLKVAAVKHAHHSFDIDHEGRDSWRLREAGAREVAVVSPVRWALMTELGGEREPTLAEVLPRLSGSDIVIVEGFKTSDHPKIEVRRLAAPQREPMRERYPGVRAVAADHLVADPLPRFDLNDVAGIAAFISSELGLKT
ncbi:MAG: molybdopterin-guanine dinucleotide biosynthesis protein B [Hyphomicrobiales bacterium]|nr:molybdopterin-guanine dinucleotide biosynthesis protein B [Hyphomicrobiales bacterium]